MRVHFFQHVEFEGPGYIEIWMKENQYQISSTHFYKTNYKLPKVEEIDALIVMGGPMGVYDEASHAWLKEEKVFIKECINSGKKILGICLGAQLIAHCLGAEVSQAEHKEIGWFQVLPTDECTGLQWFYKLFCGNPIVFHWHGDQFEIPEGAIDLLSSKANRNQAFYAQNGIIGLQFHLECTDDSLAQMLENGLDDLSGTGTYVQSSDEISSNIQFAPHCNILMKEILHYWISE
ncbi:type 1 glutamine amidotransferase [Alkalitalea saponilacus]|uniref:GMP synthase-Glutamine amidotransferase n=1 Tax=Alkalitalea saponilacus TaxID=889453 RepID=A0A1T5H413_9BACT|nr:type 1 glutamine amidotransferase [Alkalitalea saponilacus]ASB50896.1 amidotransferase [Alkalitalea saponilacus]SKC15414.1 GMP synthase-Glutamine amidotransferase [Alkalitalea saponilacus]